MGLGPWVELAAGLAARADEVGAWGWRMLAQALEARSTRGAGARRPVSLEAGEAGAAAGTWRGGDLRDSPVSALAATGRRRRGNREAGELEEGRGRNLASMASAGGVHGAAHAYLRERVA